MASSRKASSASRSTGLPLGVSRSEPHARPECTQWWCSCRYKYRKSRIRDYVQNMHILRILAFETTFWRNEKLVLFFKTDAAKLAFQALFESKDSKTTPTTLLECDRLSILSRLYVLEDFSIKSLDSFFSSIHII